MVDSIERAVGPITEVIVLCIRVETDKVVSDRVNVLKTVLSVVEALGVALIVWTEVTVLKMLFGRVLEDTEGAEIID